MSGYLKEQGSWVCIGHAGQEYTLCRYTVTRVDILPSLDAYALVIHQQGLHEWVRLAPISKQAAESIRDILLNVKGDEWT